MEEKLLFKNVSAMGEKETKALIKTALVKPIILSSIVCPLCFVVLGVLWLLINQLSTAIWMFSFAAAFAVVFPVTIFVVTQRKNRKVIDGRRLLNTYEFYDGYMFIMTQTLIEGESITNGTSNIFYNKLNRVQVTDDYIFIFINSQQCFILDQKGMLEGELEKLITFLKGKVARFKDRRKVNVN